jgi:hypothetical protein
MTQNSPFPVFLLMLDNVTIINYASCFQHIMLDSRYVCTIETLLCIILRIPDIATSFLGVRFIVWKRTS